MSTPFDDADMDYLTACTYRRLGELDTAERFAAMSVRKWTAVGASKRDSADADVTLAAIHVATGEADSTHLARTAITSVAALHSRRARMGLKRLVTELEARPRSDNNALAVTARRVAGLSSL
jgi:hypothetical protein